jgi:hypothetical protein
MLLGRRGKFDLPEVEIGIEEGDTVDVVAGVFPNVTDQANDGFATGICAVHGEEFIESKFIAGWDSGAVAAENEGASFFGEDAAGTVRAEENDGNFLRDATVSAHTDPVCGLSKLNGAKGVIGRLGKSFRWDVGTWVPNGGWIWGEGSTG